MENKKIYTINEISKIAKPVFEKYNIEKAYIFGSYARGEATKNSDIDIMTVGEKNNSETYGGLFEDLKEVLNKEIDIIKEELYTNPKIQIITTIDKEIRKHEIKQYKVICKERILIYDRKFKTTE